MKSNRILFIFPIDEVTKMVYGLCKYLHSVVAERKNDYAGLY